MSELVVAVDVGTGSARAGVFHADGRLLGRAECPIALNEPAPDQAEQDSEDIWAAVCTAVRAARAEAGAGPEAVAGIGFDATCSLVLRDGAGRPVSVSAAGEDRWDTVLWLDHRARTEAADCTATGHAVLHGVGGTMSPEMQIPKLMWIKRHLPASWARASLAFDLADFLTWKASGMTARSICTLACKWGYVAQTVPAWSDDFLATVGLADLRERSGVPEIAAAIGADLGPLTAMAAADLGLTPRARVTTGLVDAHAGALGVLGGLPTAATERCAALIAGTSNCLMLLSGSPRAAPGLWGPYRDVALPGLWATEGGQSVSGGMLAYVCRLGGETATSDLHVRIGTRIAELRTAEGWGLAGDLHVLPDFRGNRSPYSDPGALGVVSGLSLDGSFDGLCRLYWRTAVAIALGLREVLETMRMTGAVIDHIHATGGHVRSPLLMELYAAATGLPIEVHDRRDGVLLGTAMAAACAAKLHPDLTAAARAMHLPGSHVAPDPAGQARLAWDYRILSEMRHDRTRIRALSAEASGTAPGRTGHA